ncbi:hypothetical protein GCM10007276_00720 [Agaricicola taiwanensis]|uniref:Heme exporter protein D n=1 Tax=Agaricicola taiwanensis TaxID=591372 RepID=A0A8J2VIN8_9RHOB|nr:heme exporter protein CcmD [Agaricicola taiwanensis]GGE27398.1 hypothetical protein GCM10007276_00720 [Agaricicola taiwanensis]
MLGLGPHAAYIIVSYGVAALVLLGLLIWAVALDRGASREVRRLEERRRQEAKP